ncbi:TPA: lysis protein [Citrobacter murliniae]
MNIASLFQPGWKVCGVALLVGGLLGAWGTWWIANNKYTAEIAKLNQQNSVALKSISDAASLQAASNMQKQQAFAKDVSGVDQQRTKELHDALTQNQALRDDVATGTKRLRFTSAKLATCEQSASAAQRAASMVNGASVELSSEAGRNIYDIRAGIISDQAKLKTLQVYIRAGQKAGVIAGSQ